MEYLLRCRSIYVKSFFAVVCVVMFVGAIVLPAAAVDTTFVLDEQASELTINARTDVLFPLSDSDTQNLGGALNTTLDFGDAGAFPLLAEMTVNEGTISPLNPFELRLGFPPALGVNVSIADVVANVSTPSPPVTLTLLPTGAIRYEFDAANFDITLNQGVVTVDGAVNRTVDLSTSPVTGTAEPGTLGTLTFLNITPSGPFTQIDAQLDLPIEFTEVLDIDGTMVTLDVSGAIVAHSSFDLAFNADVDLDNDGAVDGADFLNIQRTDPALIPDWTSQFGSGVAATSLNSLANSVTAVPEPGAFCLFSISLLACFARVKRPDLR